MALFLITPLSKNYQALKAEAEEHLAPSDWIELQEQAGLVVSFKGTSVELSHLIGITAKEKGIPSRVGSAMVTSVGTYFGRGSTAMWEWMKTRIESQ